MNTTNYDKPEKTGECKYCGEGPGGLWARVVAVDQTDYICRDCHEHLVDYARRQDMNANN